MEQNRAVKPPVPPKPSHLTKENIPRPAAEPAPAKSESIISTLIPYFFSIGFIIFSIFAWMLGYNEWSDIEGTHRPPKVVEPAPHHPIVDAALEAKKAEEQARLLEAKRDEEALRLIEAKREEERLRLIEAKRAEEALRLLEAKRLEEEKHRLMEAERERERLRLIEAKKEEERLRIIEAEKEAERLKLIEAKRLEEEKLRLIEAEKEKERLRLIEEEKEKERLRLIAEEKEKERLRLIEEEKEKERLRILEAEREKERLRLLEVKREEERLRLIEEEKEKERLRILEAEIEKGRLRLIEAEKMLKIGKTKVEVMHHEHTPLELHPQPAAPEPSPRNVPVAEEKKVDQNANLQQQMAQTVKEAAQLYEKKLAGEEAPKPAEPLAEKKEDESKDKWADWAITDEEKEFAACVGAETWNPKKDEKEEVHEKLVE